MVVFLSSLQVCDGVEESRQHGDSSGLLSRPSDAAKVSHFLLQRSTPRLLEEESPIAALLVIMIWRVQTVLHR